MQKEKSFNHTYSFCIFLLATDLLKKEPMFLRSTQNATTKNSKELLIKSIQLN